MSIEAMKQMVEALEVEYRMYEATDPETGAPYNMIQAINAGRQAIAEASQNGLYREGYRNGYGFGEAAGKRQTIVETEEKEAEKYVIDIECTKCGAQQSGILTVHINSQSKEDHV